MALIEGYFSLHIEFKENKYMDGWIWLEFDQAKSGLTTIDPVGESRFFVQIHILYPSAFVCSAVGVSPISR